MFGINPKKMQAMMNQLGMKQEEIPVKRVIIEQEDKNIIIENPQVNKVEMQGQESFQVTGQAREESKISKEDIKQVMEKTKCTEKQAILALKQANCDLAEAILSLS